MLLPLFALAGLLFRDVRFLHGNEGSGEDGLAVIGEFATHKNAVAGLNVS